MNNFLIFAASNADARDAMQSLGLQFFETTWVMNVQLLGSGDYSKHEVYYTPAFRQTPAFVEAVAVFGNIPEEGN